MGLFSTDRLGGGGRGIRRRQPGGPGPVRDAADSPQVLMQPAAPRTGPKRRLLGQQCRITAEVALLRVASAHSAGQQGSSICMRHGGGRIAGPREYGRSWEAMEQEAMEQEAMEQEAMEQEAMEQEAMQQEAMEQEAMQQEALFEK
jgi:hypothetical protein